MATSADFIEYVCRQIDETGVIEYRKMFGEYVVYINGKVALLVCDNTVFVKKYPCLNDIMSDAEQAAPYEGAKEQYILDIDDKTLSVNVMKTIEPILEYTKPKKRDKIEHEYKIF